MEENRKFNFSSAVSSPLGKTDNHYHNTYELYYLTRGQCRYFIGEHTYLLTEGDVALIPPGVIHRTGYEKTPHSRKLINCDAWYIPEALRERLGEHPCFRGSAAVIKQIDRIFAQIEREYHQPDELSAESLRVQVGRLLLIVARESRATQEVRAESPIVERALQVIRGQYDRHLTLEQVAAECVVSMEHLSRTFKKETGFGFSEFLNLYRLKQADALLRTRRDLRVVDVAMRCGFNDSNYFSKVYRNMYGVSPKQIQKGED